MVKIAVVMGSKSDWDTMQHAVKTLQDFDVDVHYQVLSAHRTPDLLFDFAKSAAAEGYTCIVAGAGGAAHLPGMLAAQTWLPVIGVPIQSKALNGMDSLLSIVQMPAGIPVATVAIGKAGAINAGLLAVSLSAHADASLQKKLQDFRQQQTQTILDNLSPEQD